jgi:POLQ-like helicase
MVFIGGLQMKPEKNAQQLLGITQSKGKMYEYDVPEEYHINILRNPDRLFSLAIGLLGDYAVQVNKHDEDLVTLEEMRRNLQFSARFFDAYIKSHLNTKIDPYVLLLGAASFYLCDLPGSSHVLVNCIGEECPDLECFGLENLLFWLIRGDFSTTLDELSGSFGKNIDTISKWMTYFFNNGKGSLNIFRYTNLLRKNAYNNGTPRQLLFVDLICAIVKKYYINSTWYCLPKYTDLTIEQWASALQKDTFIRELWPAQQLLGEYNIYRGKSAVIQMPTSAGKTKATEIIIRSAFLTGRTNLAVIIVPFRALCHEIKNSLAEAFIDEPVNVDEPSDVHQTDYNVENCVEKNQIIIVTPEKLLYMLRHFPEMAKNIGLLIYDEGHQFDNGTRGITYELLLASLKAMVPEGVQTILISAVINNAEAIGKWIGTDSEVVAGTNLVPTYRTIAFTSWMDQLGRLEFVSQDNLDIEEYYVPRIIKQQELELRGKERKQRLFPIKDNGQDIALYLGLKLVSKGSIAIFCGKKLTADSMCERAVEVYERSRVFTKPIDFSNHDEIKRLHYLCECNLGNDAPATKSAYLGILTHHGNIPEGIRLSVECAMKEGLAKVVICTSTLAQGVNLPIRYLIVPSVYQGSERIKVRDFHNLIGRAGRSGMHTEGSILFTDPNIYDKRNKWNDKWRWDQVKELLNSDKSEPCASTILSIFEPLHSDDGKYIIDIEPLRLVEDYIGNNEYVGKITDEIVSTFANNGFTEEGIRAQLARKINIIAAIESYLMAYWSDSGLEHKEDDVIKLAQGTLAYFLSSQIQQEQIVELFKLLANNIEAKVPDTSRRKLFSKTMHGVQTCIEIQDWVEKNIEILFSYEDHESIIEILWPIFCKNIDNNAFIKCDKPEVLKEIALGWINGQPFYELYEIIKSSGAVMNGKSKSRKYTLGHIIEICENAFAYSCTFILGAVCELIELFEVEEDNNIVREFQMLQKRLRYGLTSSLAIILYELGFSDRVVCMELCSVIKNIKPKRRNVIQNLKKSEKAVREILIKYPSYFSTVFNRILSE